MFSNCLNQTAIRSDDHLCTAHATTTHFATDESCNTPMDLLLDHLFRLFSAGAELPPGSLVVTACDVMLLIPTSVAASAHWSLWSGANSGGASGSVAGLAIAADAGKYAPNHGVYCLAEEGKHGLGVDGDQTCGVMGVSRCDAILAGCGGTKSKRLRWRRA